MKYYRVLAASLQGKKNQQFVTGQIVAGERFIDPAHIPWMEKQGYVEEVEEQTTTVETDGEEVVKAEWVAVKS